MTTRRELEQRVVRAAMRVHDRLSMGCTFKAYEVAQHEMRVACARLAAAKRKRK